jgi:hypothetical protein
MMDQVLARTQAPANVRFGESTLDLAINLMKNIDHADDPTMARFIYTRPEDELVELYLAAANADFECSRNHPRADPPVCRVFPSNYLGSAEALVSPAANPNRFRQIAAAYAQMCALPVRYADRACDAIDQVARQEAYLRVVADHLDEIDAPDPGPSPTPASAQPK